MGGGLLLYIRRDIPPKLLNHDFGTNIENLSVEIVFLGSYRLALGRASSYKIFQCSSV